MKEEWKTYKFSKYAIIEVSNLGNVLKDRKQVHIRENKDGYLVIKLKNKNGVFTEVRISRLVACAFLGERDYKIDGLEVNHKDYNRKNNRLDNLEWMTHAENVRYSNCNRPDMNRENNPNYGNRKLSKIYKENPEYALEKQSRSGLQNGRCLKIRMYNDKGFDETFDFIRLCIDYLIENNISNTNSIQSVRSQIDKCVKKNRCYKGYYFEKLN